MNKLAVLVVLAACELQPAPKKQPPAPPPPSPAAVEAPPAPKLEEAGSAAGSAAPKLEVTQGCVDVGSHVAEVFIASATDPALKSVYEQERTKMVRATAEACTTQSWPPPALECYLAAKSPKAIKDCEQKFPPPPPGPRPGPPTRAVEDAPAPPTPPAPPAGTQRKPGELKPEPTRAEPRAAEPAPTGVRRRSEPTPTPTR